MTRLPASSLLPSSVLSNLRLGTWLVGVGVGLLAVGYLSLVAGWWASALALGVVIMSAWATYRPVRPLSLGSCLMVASIVWAPLMGVYGWRLSRALSMGEAWGVVLLLAPAYEMALSRFVAVLVLSSALSGVALGLAGVLLGPWASRLWVARLREGMWNSATACLALCFSTLAVGMGRSLALMGLAE